MDIQIINPITYLGWDNLLLNTPGYSFFHSSAWAKVLNESYQYKPTYFTVFERDKILALIPVMGIRSILTGSRGVSLPFSDYCEPIIGADIQLQGLLNHIIDFGKTTGWNYIELRGGGCHMTHFPQSINYIGHILNLSEDNETNFLSFNHATKKAIRRSIRKDVTVTMHNSLESVKDFYKLNVITRKRHGLPPQPYRFFEKLYDYVISKDMGIVLLASWKDRVVAGAIYFHFGEHAICKYSASEHKYHHLRANNIITWEAIKWYSQKGYKKLSFGRTDIEHQGLRTFKTGWGMKEYIIGYYKYDLKKDVFIKNSPKNTKLSNLIFSKMPLSLLKIIGSILYKHVG